MAALLIIVPLLGLVPGLIASNKGRSFFWWWVFGMLLFILALPAALLAKDMRHRCPECAEIVNAQASRCPRCQAEIAERHVVPVLQ